jgi:hypothetical protein
VGRWTFWGFAVLSATAGWGQEASRAASAPDPVAPAANSGALSWALPRVWPKVGEFRPMSSGEKWKLALRDSTTPGTIFISAAFAGLGQARDIYPSLGQGVAGFGRRFAASYGDYAIGYAMTEGVFPTILRQDPRYFRKASGGTWSRLAHAMGGIFVAYDDSGKRVFNTSRIAGDAAAVAVSNAYYVDNRSVGDAVSKYGAYLGFDTASNIFKEFWPDILRKFQRKK